MALSARKLVEQRASCRCEYCLMPTSGDVQPFQLHHVRAQKHAGGSTRANLAWSCLPCNSYKGPNVAGYDPESDTLHPLFNPRVQTWPEHFRWDGPKLHGLTPIGRTTIEVLRIHLPDRIEHRRLLILAGLFAATSTGR